MPHLCSFRGPCRMIVSDLDDTFLTKDKQIPPENLRAVAALQKAGIQVTFGTGRYVKSLRKLMKALPLTGPQLLDNGGTIADATTWRVLDSTPLPLKIVQKSYDLIRQNGFDPVISTPEVYYAYRSPAELLQMAEKHLEPIIQCPSEQELLNHFSHCVKIGIGTASRFDDLQRLLETLQAQFARPGWEANAMFTEKGIVVITSAGCCKMSGIQKICQMFHYAPEEIAAIGDGDNDVEMLQGCGLGIVMANGTERAKESATHVVGHCNDGGFAQAAELILRQK